MNKISVRPWRIMELMFDCAIQDASHSEAIVCNNVKKSDAEHIVKCVNEHDSLVAEVERLKTLLKQTRDIHCDTLNVKSCMFCEIQEACLEGQIICIWS